MTAVLRLLCASLGATSRHSKWTVGLAPETLWFNDEAYHLGSAALLHWQSAALTKIMGKQSHVEAITETIKIETTGAVRSIPVLGKIELDEFLLTSMER